MPAPKHDPSRPIQNNPVGEDFDTMPDDGRRYAIVHTGSGPFKQDEIITARHMGAAAEIPRLLAIGAIRELSSGEIDDANLAPFATAAQTAYAAPAAPVIPLTDAAGKPVVAAAPAKVVATPVAVPIAAAAPAPMAAPVGAPTTIAGPPK
jgi:hypothetical protein